MPTTKPLASIFLPVRIIPEGWRKQKRSRLRTTRVPSFKTRLKDLRFEFRRDSDRNFGTNFSNVRSTRTIRHRLTSFDIFHRASLAIRCIRFSSGTRVSISFLSEPCNCNESGARARVHATAAFQHETNRISERRNTKHGARRAARHRSESARCDAMRCDAMRREEKRKTDDQRSFTDGGLPLTESPSLHGVHPNCSDSQSLSDSRFSPPSLFSRSQLTALRASVSLSFPFDRRLASSHPRPIPLRPIRQRHYSQPPHYSTTRSATLERASRIQQPRRAAPRYRKPTDHWTSERYSLRSSFRPFTSSYRSSPPRLLAFTSRNVGPMKFLEGCNNFQPGSSLTLIEPPFCSIFA